MAAPGARDLPGTEAPRWTGDGVRTGARADRAGVRDRDELATATNLGDHAGAEPLLLESQAGLEQSPIPRMAERGRIRVVELYTAWGRPEQARKYGGTK
jgi:hypothetical protein